jgi:hypothetical protein
MLTDSQYMVLMADCTERGVDETPERVLLRLNADRQNGYEPPGVAFLACRVFMRWGLPRADLPHVLRVLAEIAAASGDGGGG